MSILQSARYLLLVATACSMLVASPAPAAVIGIFDPAFGPTIPNLGFRGSVTFDVAPACYALGPGFQLTGGACQITALSGQINFYNASTDPNNILTSVPLNAGLFPTNFVVGAVFDRATGQVTGLDTNASNPFSFSVTDGDPNFPVRYSGSMALFFVSGQAPQGAGPAVAGAFLRNCVRSANNTCVGDTSNPARATFTTVPEPDSAALALIALGALVVGRRRRSLAN